MKTSNIESRNEGGGISHKVINLPSFTSLYNSLETSKEDAQDITTHPDMRGDGEFKSQSNQVRDTFNSFRTYFRKNYPDQYAMVTGKIDEAIKESSTTSGLLGITPLMLLGRKDQKPPIVNILN
jgi:hypothetical protein